MAEPAIHRWTASDGVELAWREIGQGPPVILLHGLFSDSEMNWIKFGHAARIAGEGFRVILPDLRAHGLSGKPHDPAAYPRHVLVRDLQELIEHLQVQDYDLGGFSLGARTTIEGILSGLRPRRAILAGTGLEVLSNWEPRSHFYLEAIQRFDTAARGSPHWLAIQFMRTMNIDREAVALLLQTMNDHEDRDALVAAFSMPTLVVCGSEDSDNGSAEDLAKLLPRARYAETPGTHMTSVTKRELGEEIARFLAG